MGPPCFRRIRSFGFGSQSEDCPRCDKLERLPLRPDAASALDHTQLQPPRLARQRLKCAGWRIVVAPIARIAPVRLEERVERAVDGHAVSKAELVPARRPDAALTDVPGILEMDDDPCRARTVADERQEFLTGHERPVVPRCEEGRHGARRPCPERRHTKHVRGRLAHRPADEPVSGFPCPAVFGNADVNDRVGEQELVEGRHDHGVEQPESGAGSLDGCGRLGPHPGVRGDGESQNGGGSPDQGAAGAGAG